MDDGHGVVRVGELVAAAAESAPAVRYSPELGESIDRWGFLPAAGEVSASKWAGCTCRTWPTSASWLRGVPVCELPLLHLLGSPRCTSPSTRVARSKSHTNTAQNSKHEHAYKRLFRAQAELQNTILKWPLKCSHILSNLYKTLNIFVQLRFQHCVQNIPELS